MSSRVGPDELVECAHQFCAVVHFLSVTHRRNAMFLVDRLEQWEGANHVKVTDTQSCAGRNLGICLLEELNCFGIRLILGGSSAGIDVRTQGDGSVSTRGREDSAAGPSLQASKHGKQLCDRRDVATRRSHRLREWYLDRV